jgi:hypothetical protein
MSPLRSAPYYWAECDCCAANLQEGDDFAAWAQDDVALDVVADRGGIVLKREGRSFVMCGRCLGEYLTAVEEDSDNPDAADDEIDQLERNNDAGITRVRSWLAARREATR